MLFCLRRARPRQDDDWLIRLERTNLLQHGNPTQLRHFEIQHHDIGTFSPKEFDTLPTTICHNDGVALPTEERVQEISDTFLIVNHENLGHDALPWKHKTADT